MTTTGYSLMMSCLAILFPAGQSAQAAGPLPEVTYQGVALHPMDLSWIPTGELEHPSLIKNTGRRHRTHGSTRAVGPSQIFDAIAIS